MESSIEYDYVVHTAEEYFEGMHSKAWVEEQRAKGETFMGLVNKDLRKRYPHHIYIVDYTIDNNTPGFHIRIIRPYVTKSDYRYLKSK